MTASPGKSLTARPVACGHLLRGAECMAAAPVAGRSAVIAIAGYRFSDAERERLPASGILPAAIPPGMGGHCGTVPDRGNRGSILFQSQPVPALPAGWGEYNQITGMRGNAPAVRGLSGMVCW